jgi:cyclic beta-1,2-glucan synthetase
MFRSKENVDELLKRAEIHYAGNVDPHIFIALLMDFRDAKAREMPGDDEIVAYFKEKIAELNARYPSDIPRFYMFHRNRELNVRDDRYMGWERKRGKLHELICSVK